MIEVREGRRYKTSLFYVASKVLAVRVITGALPIHYRSRHPLSFPGGYATIHRLFRAVAAEARGG